MFLPVDLISLIVIKPFLKADQPNNDNVPHTAAPITEPAPTVLKHNLPITFLSKVLIKFLIPDIH